MLIPGKPEHSGAVSVEIARLWDQEEGSFHRCRNCAFGFARPFIAADTKVYSRLYYKDFSYPGDKWEYRRALEIIGENLSGKEASLLEIGAGNGSFLEQASRCFPELKSIFSTEYSMAAVEEIRQKGFRCLQSSVPEMTEMELPPFRVICMFQVLEHQDDLDRVFRSLHMLGPSGTDLIISVPNGRLRSFYDRLGVHLDVPPIHVGRYTPRTFRYLSERYGWELKETSFEPQSYLFKVKKFIFTRYHALNLTRRTESSGNRVVKYGLRYTMMLYLSIRYLPVVFYLLRPDSGTSLLAHLKKKTEEP